MFDYAGAIHFHSSYSYDARVPLPAILKDAQKVGLDFAILTDHFRLDAREDGLEGYHGRLLLIVGEEISPRYNHYLAFGVKKPTVVWKTQSRAQPYIDAVNGQGGFGFVAHPDHAGAPLLGSRAFPWIDWSAQGYAGLGLWDLMTDWSASLVSPWKCVLAFLRPARALRGPSLVTLMRWDELTQKEHCVAIGETDNHGHFRSAFGLRRQIFPFDFAFRTIRTHVWLQRAFTGRSEEDASAVLSALKQGQSYVSLDYWNDPKGFLFRILDDDSMVWPGGELTRKGQALLEARLPQKGRIRLIRNGRLIKEEDRRAAMQWDVDLPGIYRIEADQRAGGRWRPWIFSNPIWVR